MIPVINMRKIPPRSATNIGYNGNLRVSFESKGTLGMYQSRTRERLEFGVLGKKMAAARVSACVRRGQNQVR